MIVFDLDGTITDNRHRASVARACRAGKCTWQEYSMLAADDLPRKEIVDLMRFYNDNVDADIVILTGRNDVAYDLTVDWLLKYEVPYDRLFMRKDKDHRENSKYKLEEIGNLEAYYPWEGAAEVIYDDYKQVVQKLQKHGYNAIWVPPLWE